MCDKPAKLYGFYSSTVAATEDVARLTDRSIPCDFVMLSFNVAALADDVSAPAMKTAGPSGSFKDSAVLAYWGFENAASHQLSPGETTIMIPVKDAADISHRMSPGQTGQIAFSCFEYEVENV